MKTWGAWILAAALGCGGGAQRAETTKPPAETKPETTAQMRELFEKAQASYDRGEYPQAEEQFLAAYQIKPAPSLLFNAAVAREKQGNRAGAAELFQRYLTESPDARDRAEVQQRIAALQAP
jgi:tetratricopeptide (TPR) repeat protein